MEKPLNQPVKDYIMRVMSLQMDIPLKSIEAVVQNQFEEANKALKDSFSIEISGFCRFIFNHKKAFKEYERQQGKATFYTNLLNDTTLTEQKRRATEMKLASTLKFMEGLKPKLDKYETKFSLGGVEESSVSPREDEGIDRTDIPGEDKDM